MEDVIRKDILSVFAATIEALDKQDYQLLGAISNRTTHNATIYQDEDSLAIAVLVYALGKIAVRCRDQGKSCPVVVPQLKTMDGLLAKGSFGEYRDAVKSFIAEVGRLDEKMHMYIQEVLENARIKKGSKLHDHGLSIARAAQMLGVSQWDLMSYVGQTSISDERNMKEDARKRYKDARRLFE